ncbi:glycosyltransferase family 2 protein [bacterium]|nr:glycosyltransferase family 2 protein [bacterium]
MRDIPSFQMIPGEESIPGTVSTRTGSPMFDFTVFIPTFNRAHVLPRTLESVARQTYRNFETLIIDDGSTDGTDDLVKSLKRDFDFPIVYYWQPNQGHQAAHNHALTLARGELFIRLDSNDSLLPEALEKIKEHWNLIPEEDKGRFAGVVGLCLEEDETLAGTPFPKDILDSDYLQLDGSGIINGEKREATRTSVLRKFPYPMIEGEHHIRPTMIYSRIALEYKMRFINVPLMINRHAPDGITKRRFEYRMKNPKGLRLVFREQITLFSSYLGPRKLLRNHIRFIRYSLHSGVGPIRQSREVKHLFVWLLALPAGTLKWIQDVLRKTVKGL